MKQTPTAKEEWLPQGSMLSLLLYNIYTNDQPLDPETKCFIYADNLCVTSQHSTFTAVEKLLTNPLNSIQVYYAENSLKANPSKTKVCSFHLKNREANRPLYIIWHGKKFKNTAYPKYLGVTLDRSLTFKKHIQNCKAKVCMENNILRKLISSHLGAIPHTLRISALDLCYSAAEYAYPVWSQSAYAHRLDPALNDSCCIITRCLKSTNTNCLYLIARIAPPDIQHEVASRRERQKARHDPSHMLYRSDAANQCLKLRKSFLHITPPLNMPSKDMMIELWKNPLKLAFNIEPVRCLPLVIKLPGRLEMP